MRSIVLMLVAVFGLLLAVPEVQSVARADGYQNGYVDSYGYTWRDGYWWKNGLAYRRETYKQWDGCRCWYWAYRYIAVPVVQQANGGYETLNANTEGWRDKLLDWAMKRDSYQSSAKRSALEHNEFLEALRALGLDQQQAMYDPRYASAPSPYSMGYQQQQGYVPNAAQGDSAYGYNGGYSYQKLTEAWGTPSNIDAWMQSYSRGVDKVNDAGREGLQGMQQAIMYESEGRAKVAEYLAKAALLKAAETPSTTTREELRVYGDLQGQKAAPLRVDPQAVQKLAESLPELLATKCASCHGGAKISGKSELFPTGFDVAKLETYSVQQRRRMINVCLTGEMPQGKPPLGVDELSLMYADLHEAMKRSPQVEAKPNPPRLP